MINLWDEYIDFRKQKLFFIKPTNLYLVAEGDCKNKLGILRRESQEFTATITMATPSSKEMVFETIQQQDYAVLWEIANLIGIPENITGVKFGPLKVVLRKLSSVELEGTEFFLKIVRLIKTYYNIPKNNQFLNAFDKEVDFIKNSFENSFEHFQEETKSLSTPTKMKNCTLLSNLKNIK